MGPNRIIKSQPSVICSLCNKPTNIITDHELLENICMNCGSIIINKDKCHDENTQEDNQNKEISNFKYKTTSGSHRTDASLTRHDMGLSTVIGKTNRDASGRQIDVEMRNRINRWRTWDTRSQFQHSKEKNLHTAFIHLQKLKDKLSLPDSVIEKAAYIYRKIQEKKLANGIQIKLPITVALYISCREMEIPRTLKELAEISNADEKYLSKFYRKVIFELDLKVPQADPLKMILKIANVCKTSEKTKRDAIRLMNEIIKRKLITSKDPMGLAGAIVYMADKINGEHIIQYQIANATGVTLVTIRKNLRFLEECLK
jgi:transcription initiation factor TFIIB